MATAGGGGDLFTLFGRVTIDADTPKARLKEIATAGNQTAKNLVAAFGQFDSTLVGVSKRLAGLSQQISAFTQKSGSLQKAFSGVNQQLSTFTQKSSGLQKVFTNLSNISSALNPMGQVLDGLNNQLKEMATAANAIGQEFRGAAAGMRQASQDAQYANTKLTTQRNMGGRPAGEGGAEGEGQKVAKAVKKGFQEELRSTPFGALIADWAQIGNVANFLGITRGLQDVVKFAITANSTLEDFQVTLMAVTRSATETAQILEFAKKTSLEAPFEFKDIASAAVRFRALGLDVEKTTNVAIQLAATFGTELEPAILGVGKAFSGSAEGIEVLRNRFGLSNVKLREFGVSLDSTGGVILRSTQDIERLQEAVTKFAAEVSNNGAVAQDRVNTLLGLLSNLRDALFYAAEGFGAVLGPPMKFVIRLAIELVAAIGDLPGPLKAGIAVVLGLATAFFTTASAMAALGAAVAIWKSNMVSALIATAEGYVATAVTATAATEAVAAEGAATAVAAAETTALAGAETVAAAATTEMAGAQIFAAAATRGLALSVGLLQAAMLPIIAPLVALAGILIGVRIATKGYAEANAKAEQTDRERHASLTRLGSRINMTANEIERYNKVMGSSPSKRDITVGIIELQNEYSKLGEKIRASGDYAKMNEMLARQGKIHAQILELRKAAASAAEREASADMSIERMRKLTGADIKRRMDDAEYKYSTQKQIEEIGLDNPEMDSIGENILTSGLNRAGTYKKTRQDTIRELVNNRNALEFQIGGTNKRLEIAQALLADNEEKYRRGEISLGDYQQKQKTWLDEINSLESKRAQTLSMIRDIVGKILGLYKEQKDELAQQIKEMQELSKFGLTKELDAIQDRLQKAEIQDQATFSRRRQANEESIRMLAILRDQMGNNQIAAHAYQKQIDSLVTANEGLYREEFKANRDLNMKTRQMNEDSLAVKLAAFELEAEGVRAKVGKSLAYEKWYEANRTRLFREELAKRQKIEQDALEANINARKIARESRGSGLDYAASIGKDVMTDQIANLRELEALDKERLKAEFDAFERQQIERIRVADATNRKILMNELAQRRQVYSQQVAQLGLKGDIGQAKIERERQKENLEDNIKLAEVEKGRLETRMDLLKTLYAEGKTSQFMILDALRQQFAIDNKMLEMQKKRDLFLAKESDHARIQADYEKKKLDLQKQQLQTLKDKTDELDKQKPKSMYDKEKELGGSGFGTMGNTYGTLAEAMQGYPEGTDPSTIPGTREYWIRTRREKAQQDKMRGYRAGSGLPAPGYETGAAATLATFELGAIADQAISTVITPSGTVKGPKPKVESGPSLNNVLRGEVSLEFTMNYPGGKISGNESIPLAPPPGTYNPNVPKGRKPTR